jgi:hypothetical protein
VRFTLGTSVLVHGIDSAVGARRDLDAEIVDRTAEQAGRPTLCGSFCA